MKGPTGPDQAAPLYSCTRSNALFEDHAGQSPRISDSAAGGILESAECFDQLPCSTGGRRGEVPQVVSPFIEEVALKP